MASLHPGYQLMFAHTVEAYVLVFDAFVHALVCVRVHLQPKAFSGNVVAAWLWHAIEIGGCTHGVGTHILEDNPVSRVLFWQQTFLLDAVQAVTRGAPDAALEHHLLAWFIEDSWLYFSMVIEQAVEGAVHPVIHVVHKSWLVVCRGLLF